MIREKFRNLLRFSRFLLVLAFLPIAFHNADAQIVEKSSELSPSIINKKVNSLLNRMTLQEKVGQLTIMGGDHKDLKKYIKEGLLGGTNGVLPGKDVYHYTLKMQRLAMQSSLKIPMFFMGDVIHGFRTIFPAPLAMASSWDPKLIQSADSVAAVEATSAGVDWTFTPLLGITRDPRWGRDIEGFGEDPYLVSKYARAVVKGFQQGNLMNPHTMMATAKHFVGYSDVQAGRDYNTVDMSMHRLYQMYLPPFHAAVKQGVSAIMPAFISFNGIPATANHYLLQDILRKQWGFNGILVSDYNAIPELQQHGVAANPEEAAKLAFKAGVTIDLHSGTYFKELPKLVKEGMISKASIDSAVRRVLIMKYRLGLFQNPYRYGDSALALPAQKNLSKAHRNWARKVAQRSIVLLKNQNNVLPLSKNIHSLAVIGPWANDKIDPLGPVHALGESKQVITLLKGIKEEVGSKVHIHYAKGTQFNTRSTKGFRKAIEMAKKSDAVVMTLGESAAMSGEGNSRSRLGLPGNQLALVKAIKKTGKPIIVVLMNGRPLTINWLHNHVSAILETWFLGTEGGPAISDVLFGNYNPSGKLPMTFPRDVGQIPIFYNHLNTGRPYKPGDRYTSHYIDVPNTPLYPFGYGLSYTTFSFSKPGLNTKKLGWNDTLRVSVNVKNTGKRAGAEVVQCYIRDLVASESLPVKELKRFRKIYLKPGEIKQVTFHLTRKDLSFYNKNLRFIAQPGAFKVFVGSSSDSVETARFNLMKKQ